MKLLLQEGELEELTMRETNMGNMTAMYLSDVEALGRCGPTIYKTEFVRQIGTRFNEAMLYCKDIVFGFEYLRCVRSLYYINEPLYHYLHVNSVACNSRSALCALCV